MKDGDGTTTAALPGVDAIRHVNQFGTPDIQFMEVACVPEKVDLVTNILQANNIQLWQNISPLWEQSSDPTNTSQEAKRLRIAHFTRLLLAWWKASNFVQSHDTSLYYQKLINQAVKHPEGLHT